MQNTIIYEQQKTRELLRQLYPENCWVFTRDCNPSPEEVFERHADGKACFLGNVSSGTVSGVYGNSGEEWSYYDPNSRRVEGQWHLASAYSRSSVEEQVAVTSALRAEVEAKEAAKAKAAQVAAEDRERLLDQQAAYRKEFREARRRRLQGQVVDEVPTPPPRPSGPINGLGSAFSALGL